jgi:hypothetical protein
MELYDYTDDSFSTIVQLHTFLLQNQGYFCPGKLVRFFHDGTQKDQLGIVIEHRDKCFTVAYFGEKS